MMKPLTVLGQAVNKNVIVELKGRREYHEGRLTRRLGVVIVRGDNVIYISP